MHRDEGVSGGWISAIGFWCGEKVRLVVAEDPCSTALGGIRAAAADTRPAFHGQSVCEIMPLNR